MLGVGIGRLGKVGATSPKGVGVPALPPGFAYSRFPDGAYEVWPDGAYVVEYVG